MRILISDTNPEAVKKALDNLKPDSDFHGDRDAALARSRADWLHGMNLTRLYTKMAERNGYNGGPLRIGRVKTPVTALVVRRDEAIEAFTPKPFWLVKANIAVQNGTFYTTWKPRDEQQGLDEDKRLVDKSVGEALVTRLKGKPATITKYESKKQSSKPPVGFSLPKLQMIASKKFDLSPAKVLEICQKLYELGILTYPRSDCDYLPDAHQDEADNVFSVIETLSSLKIPSMTDKSRKTPVFNSKKVEEHHAIIPSASCKVTKTLEGDEALITSRGCHNHCWFCSVPTREGPLRELPITDGWIILDDNLLCCSEKHIRAVFDMLKRQKHRPDFRGGIEAKLLKSWHIDLFKEVKPKQIFFAYDTPDDLPPLEHAAMLFKEAGYGNRNLLRCYVLIGYPGDSFDYATKRLETVKALGFCPMAMLYRDFKGDTTRDWRRFQRSWARPAAIYSPNWHDPLMP